MIQIGKEEVIGYLEKHCKNEENAISIKELVSLVGLNKQTVNHTLYKLSKLEKEIYNIKSKRFEIKIIKKGKEYRSKETRWWVDTICCGKND